VCARKTYRWVSKSDSTRHIHICFPDAQASSGIWIIGTHINFAHDYDYDYDDYDDYDYYDYDYDYYDYYDYYYDYDYDYDYYYCYLLLLLFIINDLLLLIYDYTRIYWL
jgi:hypothetical protein